jgi:hypothetical protein
MCGAVRCARRYARRLGADLAVVVAVPEAHVVQVTLVQRTDGARYEARAGEAGTALEQSARAACTLARSRQLRGPGPWLQVVGNVTGADVYVDGELGGVVPYFGRLTPGPHHVRVVANGQLLRDAAVEFGEDPSEQAVLQVRPPLPTTPPSMAALTAVGETEAAPEATVTAPNPSPPRPTERPSNWNYGLGSALLALGAAAAGAGAHGLARAGDCEVQVPGGPCQRTYQVQPGHYAGLVGGLTAASVGTLLLFWQPLRVRVHAAPGHAALQVQRHF